MRTRLRNMVGVLVIVVLFGAAVRVATSPATVRGKSPPLAGLPQGLADVELRVDVDAIRGTPLLDLLAAGAREVARDRRIKDVCTLDPIDQTHALALVLPPGSEQLAVIGFGDYSQQAVLDCAERVALAGGFALNRTAEGRFVKLLPSAPSQDLALAIDDGRTMVIAEEPTLTAVLHVLANGTSVDPARRALVAKFETHTPRVVSVGAFIAAPPDQSTGSSAIFLGARVDARGVAYDGIIVTPGRAADGDGWAEAKRTLESPRFAMLGLEQLQMEPNGDTMRVRAHQRVDAIHDMARMVLDWQEDRRRSERDILRLAPSQLLQPPPAPP